MACAEFETSLTILRDCVQATILGANDAPSKKSFVDSVEASIKKKKRLDALDLLDHYIQSVEASLIFLEGWCAGGDHEHRAKEAKERKDLY